MTHDFNSFDALDYYSSQKQLAYVTGTQDQFEWNYTDRSEPRRASVSLADAERFRQKAILQTRSLFWNHVNAYREVWRNDNTPPEKRNRLFYAQRLASFYSTMERIAENHSCVPHSEWSRLHDLSMRYQELEAILEGKMPWQFWGRWHVMPPAVGHIPLGFANHPDWKDLKTWDGKPALSIRWKYWPHFNRAFDAL